MVFDTAATGSDGSGAVPDSPGAGPAETNELTAGESAALDRVRFVSHLLDEAVRVPGTQFRFGLDPVLSILPVAGDAVGMVLSLYPVVEAYRLGVPRRTLATMLAMVAVDAVAGSVPVLGSVFDAVWKANAWNYRFLERTLAKR